MKKFMFALAAVTIFAGTQFASVAHAEMTLNPSQHPVWSDPAIGPTVIIGYISNIDWDRAAAEQLTHSGMPVVAAGQTVKDETGIEDTCPEWFLVQKCVDLTHGSYYRENMLNIARTIMAAGQQVAFPRFSGWYKLAK